MADSNPIGGFDYPSDLLEEAVAFAHESRSTTPCPPPMSDRGDRALALADAIGASPSRGEAVRLAEVALAHEAQIEAARLFEAMRAQMKGL